MMADNTRRFNCDSCGAREYLVTVEPSYSSDVLEEQIPGALEWLRGAKWCPHCGNVAEEI